MRNESTMHGRLSCIHEFLDTVGYLPQAVRSVRTKGKSEGLVRCIGRVWSMRAGNMPKKISSTPSSRGGTPYHSTSSGHRPFIGGSGSEASLYAPCVVPANDECQAMARCIYLVLGKEDFEQILKIYLAASLS
jgi:hypothetical protein